MSKQILSGVTVLDFTAAFVGPFCSRILADMGAEVIRIERPVEGAAGERFTSRGEPSFLHLNGGKKSISVNLKHADSVDLIKRLIPKVDIIVENYTPHVMKSYGLDYESVRLLNEQIIMISLSGYGSQGLPDNPDHICTDPIAQAMSGLNWITGEADGSPYTIGGGIGDTITGTLGALALGFALVHKLRTGEGQHIDISMVESLLFEESIAMPYVALNQGEAIHYRNGAQNSFTFPMGVFKAREGYVAIQAAGTGPASGWARLCGVMGRPELVEDPDYLTDRIRLERRNEVVGIVEGWLQSLESDEAALAILSQAHISSGPVLSQEQILHHPLFRSRGAFQTVEYPELGPVEVVGPPYKFSETPAYIGGPAPQLGEHNRDVLTSMLDISEEEIGRLLSAGALYESAGAKARNGAESEAAGG